MAIAKDLRSTTLSIEVEKETDKDGNPVYKKKNFSGINASASLDAISNVAEAIKLVLDSSTGYTLINEVSVLTDND